ncbi:hypothetical protein [Chromatium okenii]|uniref:hypothetical protein n=1 Tax=Chromatium okenii TaxID=61644 RepID=UPI0026EEC657|nr:hypothetical protein [Chromatium okenii]MBV5308549.1 hypothetical protein [Chromatium okenii]
MLSLGNRYERQPIAPTGLLTDADDPVLAQRCILVVNYENADGKRAEVQIYPHTDRFRIYWCLNADGQATLDI